jgi:hypothetical protein
MSNEKPPQDQPKMEPMFLPGVEHNPKPGSFTDSIRTLQRQGGEYPQIWHMFAYLPQATWRSSRTKFCAAPAPSARASAR